MPIYEYYCETCRKTSSFLILRPSDEEEVHCSTCASREVRRILSRVAVLRSEEKRMENLLDPGNLGGLDENDPRSVERIVRKMGSELGDELGEGFQEEMEEAFAAPDENSGGID